MSEGLSEQVMQDALAAAKTGVPLRSRLSEITGHKLAELVRARRVDCDVVVGLGHSGIVLANTIFFNQLGRPDAIRDWVAADLDESSQPRLRQPIKGGRAIIVSDTMPP